jgi:hypothetical protein
MNITAISFNSKGLAPQINKKNGAAQNISSTSDSFQKSVNFKGKLPEAIGSFSNLSNKALEEHFMDVLKEFDERGILKKAGGIYEGYAKEISKKEELVNYAKYFNMPVTEDDTIETLNEKLKPKLATAEKLYLIKTGFNEKEMKNFPSGTYNINEVTEAIKYSGKENFEKEVHQKFYDYLKIKSHENNSIKDIIINAVKNINLSGKNPFKKIVTNREQSWHKQADIHTGNVLTFIEEELKNEKISDDSFTF